MSSKHPKIERARWPAAGPDTHRCASARSVPATAAWTPLYRRSSAPSSYGFADRDYLEETEFYRFLDYVPEDMRGYVEVDVEQIARDWGCDYEVAELSNGNVAVFETGG